MAPGQFDNGQFENTTFLQKSSNYENGFYHQFLYDGIVPLIDINLNWIIRFESGLNFEDAIKMCLKKLLLFSGLKWVKMFVSSNHSLRHG